MSWQGTLALAVVGALLATTSAEACRIRGRPEYVFYKDAPVRPPAEALVVLVRVERFDSRRDGELVLLASGGCSDCYAVARVLDVEQGDAPDTIRIPLEGGCGAQPPIGAQGYVVGRTTRDDHGRTVLDILVDTGVEGWRPLQQLGPYQPIFLPPVTR
jgi:hypothetical protein